MSLMHRRDTGTAVGAHPGAMGVPGNASVAPRCAPTQAIGRLA